MKSNRPQFGYLALLATSVCQTYLISNIESLDGEVDDELVIGGYDTYYVVDSFQHRC